MGTWSLNPCRRQQRGATLLETIVGTALIGVIGFVFAGALSTNSNNSGLLDDRVQASALIRTQLEEIRNEQYQDTYSVTVVTPPGFSLSIVTEDLEDELQSITVFAAHEGRPLLHIMDYKSE